MVYFAVANAQGVTPAHAPAVVQTQAQPTLRTLRGKGLVRAVTNHL